MKKNDKRRIKKERLKLVRPEFRRLLADMDRKAIADMLCCSSEAISMAITRGGMSEAMANKIELRTAGEYKSRLLVKR